MMATIMNICLLSLVTSFLRIEVTSERIPGTGLFTDKNYQLRNLDEGFGLLTYADIYTKDGSKFVQWDDHPEREEKYGPDGEWFRDGLWTFKRFGESESSKGFYVTIHHVMYPGYKLAVDSIKESPGGNAIERRYLILSNSKIYDYEGENEEAKWYKNGLWEFGNTEEEGMGNSLWNVGATEYVGFTRYGNDWYKWLTLTLRHRFYFNVKAV